MNCSGKKCVKNEKIMWTKIFMALAIGFVLLFMNFSLLYLLDDDFNN
ncbi:YWFCY domain-containing protein [Chryseobacterium sp. C-71]|nr:YWFCY domain-containing protein [Chryseobacterium sp. C-71]